MRGRRVGVVLGVGALCVWCGWVSGFHRTTPAAEITWACSVAAVVAVDLALRRGRTKAAGPWYLEPAYQPWPRPGRGGTVRSLVGLAPWLILVVVAVTWDVLGLDSGPRQTHQTISALSQAYRPLNAALLAVWMLVGVGYEAARVRAPARTGARPPTNGETPARRGARGPGVLVAGGLAGAGHHGVPGLLLPQSPAAGVAFWVAVPVIAVVLDLAARSSDGRLACGEEAVRFVSTPVWGRVVLVVAWLFAGYHLFAR